MFLIKPRPATMRSHNDYTTTRTLTRTHSSPSSKPISSSTSRNSSNESTISGDDAAISSIRFLEENVHGWKNQLKLLGRDFEELVGKVERINTKYRAVVSKTINTARTQITLVRQVRHLYHDIAALDGDTPTTSQKFSSFWGAASNESKRLQDRASDLKRDIEGMYAMQHECALEFQCLGEDFTQVKDRVEDKIAQLKKKVRQLEDKEGKYKRIAQFAASAGLFAAAAAAIAGVFSFGTASLVVPIIISTVGPIVSFHATNQSQKLKQRAILPRRATHILETINECMTQKVDNCMTLSDRWTNIGNKVYELNRLLSRSDVLEASQLAIMLLCEWEDVEKCLDGYESLVDELKHSKHTGLSVNKSTCSDECSSTATGNSSSVNSAEKWFLVTLLN